MADVGYIRVSSLTQNTGRQLADIKVEKLFQDKVSGKNRNRPGLQTCFEYLREGDTLHVHSMDRLARNLADLQKMVEDLNKKGVVVKFHKEGLEFTGEDSAMSRLLMQMMGAVAEFERSLIRERQREGIALAKKKGVRCGRKPSIGPNEQEKIIEMLNLGETKKNIAAFLNVSRQTIYKATRDIQVNHSCSR